MRTRTTKSFLVNGWLAFINKHKTIGAKDSWLFGKTIIIQNTKNIKKQKTMNEKSSFVRNATVQLVAAHLVNSRETKMFQKDLIDKCVKIAEEIYNKTLYVGL